MASSHKSLCLPTVQCKGAGIASTKSALPQTEYELLVPQLRAQSISPSPGLQLSQLHELANLSSQRFTCHYPSSHGRDSSTHRNSAQMEMDQEICCTLSKKRRPSSSRASTSAVPPSPATSPGPIVLFHHLLLLLLCLPLQTMPPSYTLLSTVADKICSSY